MTVQFQTAQFMDTHAEDVRDLKQSIRLRLGTG
jgi:hypothetical protein